MDLLPQFTAQSQAFQQDLAALRAGDPYAALDEAQAFEEWLNRERQRHLRSFPINDNLFARLSAHMTMRGVRLQDYNFDQIRECMVELFCVPRSALENPSYRVNSQGRSFAVLDYGELEGTTGYWAECEETGEEGFLADYDDCFGLTMMWDASGAIVQPQTED